MAAPGFARVACAIVALLVLLASCQSVVVHEVRSSYSHIQVVDHGSRRAMVFLGETPSDAIETIIDLREPHRLQHPYARTMTAGLIYRPVPWSVRARILWRVLGSLMRRDGRGNPGRADFTLPASA